MEELSIQLELLLKSWETKLDAVKEKKEINYERYSCNTLHNGKPGRPSFDINIDQIVNLRDYHFKLKEIALILSISRTTIWRRLKEHGIDTTFRASDISQDSLNEKVKQLKDSHPLAGERMIIGFLRAEKIHVQRWKVRESIHTVDPANCATRWLQKNPRWIYSVPT